MHDITYAVESMGSMGVVHIDESLLSTEDHDIRIPVLSQ